MDIIGEHNGQQFFVGAPPTPTATSPTNTSTITPPSSNLPGVAGANVAGMTPTNTVTTADPANSAVNNLGFNIGNAANNPPSLPTPTNPSGTYNPAYDPNTDPTVMANITASNQVLLDRQTALQKERDAEIQRLTEQQGRDQQSLKETQANETGSTSRNLLYLQQGGQSASAQAYLNGLEVSHNREMDNLTAKYNSAIQAARSAYADKDFQLAQKMVENANEVKKTAYSRNQDFLDNSIKIHNEIQEDQKNLYQRQKDLADNYRAAADFAVKNGITQPFYELGGNVFNTKNGMIYDPNDPEAVKNFLADGGAKDYANVFVVKPSDNKTYAGGDLGEWQYLLDKNPDIASGQFHNNFMEFLHAKANQREKTARAGASVSISYGDQRNAKLDDAVARYGVKLSGSAGGDQHVSPETYKKGYLAWTSEGLPGKDYKDNFSGFINYSDPNWANNYGIQ